MRLKIPPLFVTLITALLMYGLAKFLPFGSFDFTGRRYLMFVLLSIGGLIGPYSLVQFFIKKTSINPVSPTNASVLVTKGIYNFTRNPMYLALLLLLLGWGLYLSNAFNVLLAAGFVAYMNKFQIIPEEEALLNLFGKEYTQYCALVRRWF